MANCAGIISGADIDCQNPLVVGLTQRLMLANLNDVDTITYSVTPGEENVITGITMKSGKAFFEFAGVNESIKAQSELVRGSVSNSYRHQLDFSIFEVDNVQLQNMQGMAYQPQIGITISPDDSSFGNGAFQVWGSQAGLDLLQNIRINGDVETGGAHVLQLASPESGRSESELPNVFWSTDYATTLALIEALKTPA